MTMIDRRDFFINALRLTGCAVGGMFLGVAVTPNDQRVENDGRIVSQEPKPEAFRNQAIGGAVLGAAAGLLINKLSL